MPSTDRQSGAADVLGVALTLAVIVGVAVTDELGVVETEAVELGVGLTDGTGQHCCSPGQLKSGRDATSYAQAYEEQF